MEIVFLLKSYTVKCLSQTKHKIVTCLTLPVSPQWLAQHSFVLHDHPLKGCGETAHWMNSAIVGCVNECLFGGGTIKYTDYFLCCQLLHGDVHLLRNQIKLRYCHINTAFVSENTWFGKFDKEWSIYNTCWSPFNSTRKWVESKWSYKKDL